MAKRELKAMLQALVSLLRSFEDWRLPHFNPYAQRKSDSNMNRDTGAGEALAVSTLATCSLRMSPLLGQVLGRTLHSSAVYRCEPRSCAPATQKHMKQNNVQEK